MEGGREGGEEGEGGCEGGGNFSPLFIEGFNHDSVPHIISD